MKVQIKNIKYYVNKEKKTTVCTAKVFVIFSNQDCINYILAKRIRKKSGKTPVFTVVAKCKCHNDDTFDEVIGKSMKLMDIICEVNQEICDGYCKYPNMPIPEGKDEDWLINDEDSPCISCPFNKLFKAAD